MSEVDLRSDTVTQPSQGMRRAMAEAVESMTALTIAVTGAGEDTLLAEIARLMEAAEQRRALRTLT